MPTLEIMAGRLALLVNRNIPAILISSYFASADFLSCLLKSVPNNHFPVVLSLPDILVIHLFPGRTRLLEQRIPRFVPSSFLAGP